MALIIYIEGIGLIILGVFLNWFGAALWVAIGLTTRQNRFEIYVVFFVISIILIIIGVYLLLKPIWRILKKRYSYALLIVAIVMFIPYFLFWNMSLLIFPIIVIIMILILIEEYTERELIK